jgi:hypothetical protein
LIEKLAPRLKTPLILRLKATASKLIPFLEPSIRVSLPEILKGYVDVAAKAELKVVCLVEPGERRMVEADREIVKARTIAQNLQEYGWWNHPFMLTYAWANPDFPYEGYSRLQSQIISNAIDKATRCVSVMGKQDEIIEVLTELVDEL